MYLYSKSVESTLNKATSRFSEYLVQAAPRMQTLSGARVGALCRQIRRTTSQTVSRLVGRYIVQLARLSVDQQVGTYIVQLARLSVDCLTSGAVSGVQAKMQDYEPFQDNNLFHSRRFKEKTKLITCCIMYLNSR